MLSGCETRTPCVQWLLNRGGSNGWEMTAMLQVLGEETMDRKGTLGRGKIGYTSRFVRVILAQGPC